MGSAWFKLLVLCVLGGGLEESAECEVLEVKGWFLVFDEVCYCSAKCWGEFEAVSGEGCCDGDAGAEAVDDGAVVLGEEIHVHGVAGWAVGNALEVVGDKLCWFA